jgi:hypothetical protein
MESADPSRPAITSRIVFANGICCAATTKIQRTQTARTCYPIVPQWTGLKQTTARSHVYANGNLP